MQKIAAIDAGSNAMRMIVGNVDDNWHVQPLENIRLPVRLGQDVFASGALQEKTLQQAVDAFRHFRRVADGFGVVKIRAIATSAMREAANGDILLDRISRTSGIDVEVISGAEEARLIHMGVADQIKLKGRRAVLIDIGGGSVEFTISENGNIVSTDSYNMGTVRLLEKLDGSRDRSLGALGSQHPFSMLVREYAEAARRRIDRELGSARVHICIGTGGNVEDLGRLRQRYFKETDATLITLDELETLIETLGRISVKERIRKFKLRPDRADVILPAAIVLHIIAHEAHVRSITIPGVGLKDGLLLEMADQLRTGPHVPRREQVWQSAVQLGRKYDIDSDHARLTARLAGQLFDQSRSLHSLGEEQRLLLEVGALLHDIGHFINTLDHDQHGYYILQANPLIGLDEHQQAIVANIVRYHRRSVSGSDDPSFKSLPQKDRIVVTKLSALLRLADGMDVSHANHVMGVSLVEKKKVWELSLRGRGDLMLEKWALNKRRVLFEEVFGVPLVIQDMES
ncbi:MAG TPA: Ppx/GppA phosphatase family protein [Anaerolineales bacterium]|nr:Ppx/GppA phosphatase family protein [Anaerolineales bacterium]